MSAPRYTTGWVYNLDAIPSSTNASNVIILACVMPSIALLFLCVRLVIRRKTLGVDDAAVVGSTLLSIAYSGIAIYQTRWGLGLSSTDFPLQNAVGYSRIQYIGGPIYCLAILGFKISLLLFYRRIAGVNNTYRIVLNVVMALVIANQIIYTFLLSFGCMPVAKTWDPSIDGTCLNTLASYFGLGGSSLGFDLIIIALPFPVLRKLQLDHRKKITIGVLFALGFFVTLTQVFRMNTIAKLQVYTDSEEIIKWSIAEINVGVIVACAPALAPLLRIFGQKVSQGRYGSSRRQQKSSALTPSFEFQEHVKRRTLRDGNTSDEDTMGLFRPQGDWTILDRQWEKSEASATSVHPCDTPRSLQDVAEASGCGREQTILVKHEFAISTQEPQDRHGRDVS